MNQLPLDFIPDRKRAALIYVETRPELFRKDFAVHLADNWHVYEAFAREADKVWARGQRHYSARTVIEVLRHESALRESGSEWKLNDWWTKDLARLWICMHPERDGFFEFRNGQSAVRAA